MPNVKVVTIAGGQGYIEQGEGDSWSLVPAHVWLENQVAVPEIGLAFDLLYQQRRDPAFRPFLHWLLGKLREKYADRWPKLLDAYLESPRAASLLLEMEINEFLNPWANAQSGGLS